MRDHRADRDPNITDAVRHYAARVPSVTLRRPDWTFNGSPKPAPSKIKKAKRRQAEQSRRRKPMTGDAFQFAVVVLVAGIAATGALCLRAARQGRLHRTNYPYLRNPRAEFWRTPTERNNRND